MLIGELMFKHTDYVYTPAAPRGGNSGIFGIQVLQVGPSSPTLDCDIQHRNSIDDTWTTAASFTQMTATGTSTKSASNLLQLVRLRFKCGGSAYDAWARFFVLAPVWEAA